MGRVNGIFFGDKTIGSTYDDSNGFIDILCEDLDEKNVPSDIIFASENNDTSASNQLLTSISLAYRSLCEMRKKNITPKRIYEIVCSEWNVCSYAVVGLENKDTTIEMSQTIEIDNTEDRNLLALEYLHSVYEDRFRGSKEVEELGDLIDQYRTDVLCGYSENLLLEKYRPLVEGIEKIQSHSEEVYFEFAGQGTTVFTKPIRKIILRELAKEYLVRIQTLAHNMSANFGTDDCIYIYTDIQDFSLNYRSELDEIGINNHVMIEAFNDRKIAIAQGNAYYHYLFNNLFVKQIKDKIGKYAISYNKQEYSLNEFHGELTITIDNDFQIFPIIEVIDKQNAALNEWEIIIPFFKCGDTILVSYMFENDYIRLQACHLISGEKSFYTLMFRK